MKQYETERKHSKNAVILTKRQFRKSILNAAKARQDKLNKLVEKYS